jgi:hypothetical protein
MRGGRSNRGSCGEGASRSGPLEDIVVVTGSLRNDEITYDPGVLVSTATGRMQTVCSAGCVIVRIPHDALVGSYCDGV